MAGNAKLMCPFASFIPRRIASSREFQDPFLND